MMRGIDLKNACPSTLKVFVPMAQDVYFSMSQGLSMRLWIHINIRLL